ncbi:MAG: DUF6544 family protein [Albidovulum sp.]
MQTVLAIVLLLMICGLAVQVALSRGFRSRSAGLIARLHDSPQVRPVTGLPQPVHDFAVRSGAQAGSGLRIASLTQVGELRLKQGGAFGKVGAWQAVALGTPGFVWLARLDAGPVPKLRILDAYVRGAGQLEARAFGSVRLARAGGAALTLGEAYRYLAELPFVPDAILGNPEIEWRLTARNIAEARMATPAGAARVSFRFDAAGDIVEMEAKGRPTLDADGAEAKRDWRGYFRDYRQIGPRRIPATAEVGYVYPEGYEAYYRLTVTDNHLAP